jgi:flavin reductase (DIM6/NTAB) family NADH-FMN oxidoreductase RutF
MAVYTAAMEINPAAISQADRYKLLIGCIVPRPIAFVSTSSPDEKHLNLAPFSFFNGVGSNPMTLLFCPANKADGSEKDTLRNCKPREEGGTGQFVVNVATEEYIREVAASSEMLAYGESEFELTGLTPAPSVIVKPPRVKQSPVAFECQTVQVVRTNPGAPAGGNIVIGRVAHVFVRDDLITERFHIDQSKLSLVGRMGGLGYTCTRDRFELPMSREALRSGVPAGAEPPPLTG